MVFNNIAMSDSTRLNIMTVGSVLLIFTAIAGRVGPKITMSNGEIHRSLERAEKSGFKIESVDPSAGDWLKVLLAAGGTYLAASAVAVSRDAELEAFELTELEQSERRKLALANEAEVQLEEIRADSRLNVERQSSLVMFQQQAIEEAALLCSSSQNQPGSLATSTPIPVPNAELSIKAPVSVSPAGTKTMPGDATLKTNVTTFNREDKVVDVTELMAKNLQTALIIGVPGSGKGMVVSNAIRHVRRIHPHIKIFIFDPKADPKEAGYYDGVCHHLTRCDSKRMTGTEVCEEFESFLTTFREHDGPKLMVFDDFTSTSLTLKSTSTDLFNDYVNFKVNVASNGDSEEIFIWEIGQIANASDMGVSGGLRGLSKPIAIVSKKDRRATNELLRTSFVPKPKGGKDAVYDIMDASPIGRAIYDYSSDEWRPMPILENHSGYDRDSRKFVGDKPSNPPAVSRNKEALMNEWRACDDLSKVIAKNWKCQPGTPAFEKGKAEFKKIVGID